jgi:hypothetical protein
MEIIIFRIYIERDKQNVLLKLNFTSFTYIYKNKAITNLKIICVIHIVFLLENTLLNISVILEADTVEAACLR